MFPWLNIFTVDTKLPNKKIFFYHFLMWNQKWNQLHLKFLKHYEGTVWQRIGPDRKQTDVSNQRQRGRTCFYNWSDEDGGGPAGSDHSVRIKADVGPSLLSSKQSVWLSSVQFCRPADIWWIWGCSDDETDSGTVLISQQHLFMGWVLLMQRSV